MKFIRTHITIIAIVIMSALCLCAIGVAVNLSLIRIQRRHQMVVETVPVAQGELNKNKIESININKLRIQSMVLNGIEVEDIRVYADEKGKFLLPVEAILNKVKIPYQYYASDRILEWSSKEKKIKLHLGEDGFWLGKNKVSLGQQVLTGKNHILASLDLFDFLHGFTSHQVSGFQGLFLDYNPEYSKELTTYSCLSKDMREIKIMDLLGQKVLWQKEMVNNLPFSVEPSYGGLKFLIKSGKEVYLFQPGVSAIPVRIPVDPKAQWSGNGRLLLWTEPQEDISYIYDVVMGTKRKVSQSLIQEYRVNNLRQDHDFHILMDYKKGNRYESITFTDQKMKDNFTIIMRNGKRIISGNVLYSPDRKKLLYEVTGKGFYYANADGTRRTFLAAVTDVHWINSNRFVFTSQGKNFIFNWDTKKKTPTGARWKYLGKTENGEILFSIDQILYSEAEGRETELMKLPWICDAIHASSAKGPFIFLSRTGQGIFFANHKSISMIGEIVASSEEREPSAEEEVLKNLKITFSPDHGHMSFYQQQNGLLSLGILDTENHKLQKVMLGFSYDVMGGFAKIKTKWLSNTRLVVFSGSKWSVIDIQNQIKVYTKEVFPDALGRSFSYPNSVNSLYDVFTNQ